MMQERHRRSTTHRSIGYADATLSHAKTKTTKKAIYIIIAYVLCWTPYYVVTIAGTVNPFIFDELPLFRIMNSFIIVNALANPLIYGVFL